MLAVAALSVAALALTAAPAEATTYQYKLACSDRGTYFGFIDDENARYKPGEWCLYDGTHKLAFQSDGNLVLYTGSTVVWASHTATTAGYINFQRDGNVVIYNGSGSALWSTKSGGHGYPNYAVELAGAKASVYGYTYTSTTAHLLWRAS